MERLNMESIEKISLLYDFYGRLLTEKQRQVMELYHEENLSLAEIAAEFGISRQGVHDALKNAERALSEYEAKLGLVAKFRRSSDAVRQIDSMIDSTIELLERGGAGSAEKAAEDLKKVKHIIDELEE